MQNQVQNLPKGAKHRLTQSKQPAEPRIRHFAGPRVCSQAVARMASLLSPADIKKVMATFAGNTSQGLPHIHLSGQHEVNQGLEELIPFSKAPDSFNHAQFFVLAGLKNQNIEKLKDIFHLLDRNQTGFIEKNELSFMMRIFSPEGRLLTDAETNRMMAAGDKDQDGKLGVDEFIAMVTES
ncbi:parvalbumin alpha [Varanus komodoensis]|uniref:parvalbumin alpha n=1 Tax=Varanus komodoensis TaxID=61221 RepID=UPI001CF7EC51|nr:parvalbumin alpha [Varanus komodoensis]